jgi:hypothetical protein
MPIKGTYLALAGAGAIVLWSGLRGKSWTDVLRQVVAGKKPEDIKTTSAILPIDLSPSSIAGDIAGAGNTAPANAGLDAMLTDLAHQKGWNSQQVACWHQLIAMESNGPTDTNPSSGAFGWAQALGHGTSATAGCGRNEYGGFGLSAAQAQKANCGSAPEQLLWMANYIEVTYRTPCAAVQFHLSHNWY